MGVEHGGRARTLVGAGPLGGGGFVGVLGAENVAVSAWESSALLMVASWEVSVEICWAELGDACKFVVARGRFVGVITGCCVSGSFCGGDWVWVWFWFWYCC